MAWSTGVQVKASSKATDLGLDVSTKPHRHLHHTRKRIAKAMRRDGRVRKLQLKRARTRVCITAVIPAAAYTAAALGVAPSALSKLRAAAAAHLGRKAGMCCTSFFAMVDPGGDHEITLPCRLLDMFLKVVMPDPRLKAKVEQAWGPYPGWVAGVATQQEVGQCHWPQL